MIVFAITEVVMVMASEAAGVLAAPNDEIAAHRSQSRSSSSSDDGDISELNEDKTNCSVVF